jgi:hypothetical protein
VVIDDAKGFNEKLREVGGLLQLPLTPGGLGGQTPYERLKQKTAPTTAAQL